jgi:hypothetical protein
VEEGGSLCTPHLLGARTVEQTHVHRCLKVASAAHCQLAGGLGSALVWVLWGEECSPCADELHCMTESADGYLRSEADYGQETAHKTTLHYAEGDVG